MVMVLSDTEAVRVGVIVVVGSVVVITGGGVGVTEVTVTTGSAGCESEHPLAMSRRDSARSTGTDLIDAGRSFPYNNMVVMP